MSGERAGEASEDVPVASAHTPGVRAAIARAKLEWEGTVDALPDLICLLDGKGRVLRVNRVCERWNLGSIAEVLGRELHDVLHANCSAGACQLHESLRSGWLSLQGGGPAEFELRDAILERALHVTLRRMTPGPAGIATEPLAVAVLAAVTAPPLAREAVSAINLEPETRVPLPTDALAGAHRDPPHE